MTALGQFYQQGGVFMHLITLLSLAATGMLVARAARLRRLVRRVTAGKPARPVEPDGLLVGLIVAAAMISVLATTLGVMQACTALRTIPPEQHVLAIFRAVPIALSPLVWGLALGTPLVLGRAVVGAIETRLRALANR